MTNFQEIFPFKKNWQGSLRVLIIILAVLILGIGAVGYQRTRRPPSGEAPPLKGQPTVSPPPKTALVPSPSTATLVYGVWEEGNSTVRTVNSDGSNHIVIAKLPSNIKDVNFLSDHELIYIAETDDRDHGQRVNFYSLVTGQTKTLFAAAPGFGIDDLVVSPDKKWVATWEVKFALNSKILSGGDSRVYTVNLINPQYKILIVDERNVSTSNFLRYPLFFDSQNRLFLDTFGPNGGGWNRGLWVVNSDGADLAPVTAMADGEYSTDPILSPDGTKIVFTGYDPTASPQIPPDLSSGILRPAIANPNLLQVMDLANFAKTTLLGSEGGAQYANPVWSKVGNQIAFQKFKVINPESSEFEGVFTYDLASGRLTQVLTAKDHPSLEILSLDKETLFWGQPTQNTGNLGQNYQAIFDGLFVTNLSALTTNPIITGPALQLIEIVSKAPGEVSAFGTAGQLAQPTPDFTLQLKSFEVKPLAQVRNPQQNDKTGLPRCRDLLGSERASAQRAGKCTDSPLYLYPQEETLVTIKVKPPAQVLYSEPVYKNGWQVLAKPNGEMKTSAGQFFDKISYAYFAPEFTPPKEGLIVKREELASKLTFYAQKLGLLGKEVRDFTAFWQENLPPAPYYFVSHFNQKEAAEILSFEINPQPDIFIQALMYFKPLKEPIKVESPFFEPIPERQGFIAVDWSGMIAPSTPGVD